MPIDPFAIQASARLAADAGPIARRAVKSSFPLLWLVLRPIIGKLLMIVIESIFAASATGRGIVAGGRSDPYRDGYGSEVLKALREADAD
ncbi:hypothetical protein TA3x_005629 [Tundrisphaera sp. TA3]|uniref:hypothetical protein n=1 Tax=Tundrisphaera sp. TA3 TaxID=3435775 RepID=UPI003EB92F39